MYHVCVILKVANGLNTDTETYTVIMQMCDKIRFKNSMMNDYNPIKR